MLKKYFSKINNNISAISDLLGGIAVFNSKIKDLLGLTSSYLTLIILFIITLIASIQTLIGDNCSEEENNTQAQKMRKREKVFSWVIISISSLLIITSCRNWYTETEALPSNMISGRVLDLSGNPVENASIRIICANGEDITKGQYYPTTNEGLYIIETSKRPHRDDFIRIICDTSKANIFKSVRMFREYEKDGKFEHEILQNCQNEK